jgi:hypothetical protein
MTGGLAYACTGGSYETASNIWSMSLGGTYALTPAMLRGEEAIAFAGASSSESSVVSEATPPEPEVQSKHGRRDESLPAT